MDRCDSYANRRHRETNPSFSSTLLDAIYRSIDEGKEEQEVFVYRETMRKKRSSNCAAAYDGGATGGIEEWMEKKVSEKVVVRRNFERKLRSGMNSSSSSSDSSSGGGFSSSEAESGYGASSRSSGVTAHRPKPIRTSVSFQPEKRENGKESKYASRDQKAKHENGFGKTKSRAMKIYGDLKKVKQPISPGGRLATFLNSLFTTGTPKKVKISSSNTGFQETISDNNHNHKSKSSCGSTCSSASSFSRSCLSNPSSRGKLSNGEKRSVRFYPINVVLGEENCPSYKDELRNSINEELKLRIMEKNRRVEEAARDLLKNYQKMEYDYFNVRDGRGKNDENFDNDEDDDEDDAASCASSDLFELDNLSAIGGIERYREELPVYETTHLDTNLAIANGLIS